MNKIFYTKYIGGNEETGIGICLIPKYDLCGTSNILGLEAIRGKI